MKTKRPTPHKLPSGRWNVQVRVGDKRISVTDDDMDVCQARAIAIQAGVIQEDKKKPKALTLESAIDEYIASKNNALSPSTVRGYETVKKHRFKSLMKRDVYSITKKDVQIAVNQECKSASPKTIANAYGVVRPVLKQYGIDVFGVTLPKKSKPEKQFLQIDEIAPLLNAVSGDSCEAAILLALWLGMRRSEIIGLCWDCVDENTGKITVRRTVVPDKDHKMILKEMTKNQSSNRILDCPPYIMEKLSAMRNGRSKGQVFNIHPDTLRKHIHRVCEIAGITDTTTHGLRHTNAAVMRHLGISDAHAMERGGWTEERTYKRTYSYVFDRQSEEEDKELNRFFLSKTQNGGAETFSSQSQVLSALNALSYQSPVKGNIRTESRWDSNQSEMSDDLSYEILKTL